MIRVVFGFGDVKVVKKIVANCIAPSMCAGTKIVEEWYLTRVWINDKPVMLKKQVEMREVAEYCSVEKSIDYSRLLAVCTDSFAQLLEHL